VCHLPRYPRYRRPSSSYGHGRALPLSPTRRSSDLGPVSSINFLTAHDGFTHNELISYDHKHNEENGEENRDGTDNNLSWNHGEEGPTTSPQILADRTQSMRNLIGTLLVAAGVPMITGGDEFGRSQHGNNNM